MLSKLILAFILFGGLYLLLRHLSRSADQIPPPPAADKPSAPAAEAMIECRQCGVHVPQSEVVFASGYTFCSTAHRDQYLTRP